MGALTDEERKKWTDLALKQKEEYKITAAQYQQSEDFAAFKTKLAEWEAECVKRKADANARFVKKMQKMKIAPRTRKSKCPRRRRWRRRYHPRCRGSTRMTRRAAQREVEVTARVDLRVTPAATLLTRIKTPMMMKGTGMLKEGICVFGICECLHILFNGNMKLEHFH